MRRSSLGWRMACIGMAVTVALSACSALKKQKKPTTQVEEGQLQEEGKEKAQKVESLKLQPDSAVLAVGGTQVPFKEILAYMYLLKSQYEPAFGKGVWEYEVEGQAFGKKSLEEVLHMATQMKVIRKEAEAASLSLTVDEADEINVKAQNFLSEVPQADVERYGLDAGVFVTIFSDNEIAGKMFDVCMNEVNTQISDEEARQMVLQYLLVLTDGTDKNGNAVKMDAGEKAEALERAKALQKDAKKADSFYSFAEAHTDAQVVERTMGRGVMSQEFTDAALALKKGETSGVVESPEGFYILYCVKENDKNATGKEKERRILSEQTKVFEEKYAQWAGKYEVRISNLLWSYDYFSDATNG